MNVFGLGIPELLLIFVIAMVVLGPGNMVKYARDSSTAIRKFLNSELWRSVVNSTREIRTIQDSIIKDTGLPESLQSLRQSARVATLPASKEWVRTDTIPQNQAGEPSSPSTDQSEGNPPETPVP